MTPTTGTAATGIALIAVRGAAGRAAVRLAAVALLIAIWWLIAELQIWSPLLVPSPGAVWHQFVRLSSVHDGVRGYSGSLLIEHLAISLRRILIGSVIGSAVGVAVGLAIGTSTVVRLVLEPLVTFLRQLPPLAYFSLLIIWFGIDDASKVWLLFLAAFPPIALSVLGGVRGIRQERIDAALALGARRHQVLRFVVLPSVLPELFTGIRLSIGFAWTTIVAAETMNGIPGIGGLAWETKKFQQTDVAVLCIIVIGLSAILLDLLVKAAERTLVPWRGRA
jgi:taurine transport system permease protein